MAVQIRIVAFVFVIVLNKVNEATLLLPKDMKQDVYCETCAASLKAFVDVVDRNLSPRVGCNQQYLEKFKTESQDLSDVRTTCLHLIKHYGGQIKKKIAELEGEKLEEWLCINKSYACLGINRSGKVNFGKNSESDMVAIKEFMKKNKDKVRTPHARPYLDEL